MTDVVARHVATFGIAAVDFADRAAGDRGGVARRGAIPGIAAVDDVVDRAAGDCDSVFRHGTLLGSAAVDPCIIIDHAALDDHMVFREVICPPE